MNAGKYKVSCQRRLSDEIEIAELEKALEDMEE